MKRKKTQNLFGLQTDKVDKLQIVWYNDNYHKWAKKRGCMSAIKNQEMLDCIKHLTTIIQNLKFMVELNQNEEIPLTQEEVSDYTNEIISLSKKIEEMWY
jgi:hypothetical protein